jgi:type IV pilus assembly protein PilQ
MLSGALAVASDARAADTNTIRAVDVAERDGAVELTIQGSRPASYTVFKLQDPPRLVVDLSGADVSAVASPVDVGKGGVIAVSTAQYKDAKSQVGRVIVALDGARRYEVQPRGDAVVVRVIGESAAAAESPAPAATAAVPAAPARPARPEVASAPAAPAAPAPAAASVDVGKVVITANESAPASAPAPAPAAPKAAPAAEPTPVIALALPAEAPAPQAAEPAAPAAPAPHDNVVSRRMDEKSVRKQGQSLTGVRVTRDGILIATDGEVAKIEIIELRDPPRLAVDLHGITRAPRAAAPGAHGFAQVRFGRDAGKTRVVLDGEGTLPAYEVKRVSGGVAVVVPAVAKAAESTKPAPAAPAPAAPAAAAAASEPTAPVAVAVPAPRAKAADSRAKIADVRFAQSGRAARIEISGKARYTLSRPDARTVVLSLDQAELPKKLERSLDTSAFDGPVMMVSSFNQPSTGQVKIVASLRAEAADKIVETPNGIAWTFTSGATQPPQAARAQTAEPQAAGFAQEAPGYALSGAPQKKGYSGRRITLDFHDIEIRNLLRLIADVSKKNIVVSDDVTGKVTVSLRNVPWDQALDLILKTKGLDKEEMGNVIRIARYEELAKEQKSRADAAEARKPLIPLKVRLIPVNFARAADVSGRVKDVLSERGTISVDERTNVLIVKDIQENLVKAEGLVRNLDTEIPQVLIESRIVEASSNFTKALGVQWGGGGSLAQATANPTGLIFPNNVVAAGGITGGQTTGTANAPQYAVSLPAPVGDGSGGAIGLILGSASGAFNLNLRLSALENRGVVKTISAPKVATIDNKEATIGQGISIPFSQTSASGVNTTFIEAKLELKVTPHVSADGSILLKIKATNNAPNPQLTGANGQPSISKREADTEVLVKDGETTVIGGIYTRATSHREAAVPFLGKIPIIGYLFRNESDQDDHTEMLIFITPRILNRPSANVAASGN